VDQLRERFGDWLAARLLQLRDASGWPAKATTGAAPPAVSTARRPILRRHGPDGVEGSLVTTPPSSPRDTSTHSDGAARRWPASGPGAAGGARDGLIEQTLRTLRRRKWVFLQAVILVPLLVLVFSLAQEDEYQATATLLFRQAPEGLTEQTDTGFVDPAREAATNDQLVTLPVVAERAAESIGGDFTGSDVLDSVSVDSGGEADIAEISATSPSPERAARIANAYGEAYIGFRREADRRQVQSAIDLVTEGLAELSPSGAAGEDGAELQGQLERLELQSDSGEQGAVLRDRLEQLELAQALQTGKAELVQRAEVPSERASPQPVRNTAIGVVLGALLGFGLAALLERVDRRVRSVDELEDLFGLPILARIPQSRSLERDDEIAESGVVTPTPEGEAFRVLRTNLRYFSIDRPMRSILVASPEVGEGKSTVARNLARTMAEMGDNVILVEADLHKGPSLVDGAAGSQGEGLSSVLAGASVDRALLELEVRSASSADERTLTVLPSGPVPPNPSELLESDRMRVLIQELQDRFDVVILDSPALSVVSDGLALVPDVSRVVVVGGLGQTTREGVRSFIKQLSLLGTQPIGVIANFTEVERGGSSYYYRPPAVHAG
jgi:capsular exopolysaccharide synthesis family protein